MLHGPGIKSAEDGEGWNDALDASREEACLSGRKDVTCVCVCVLRGHVDEREVQRCTVSLGLEGVV